MVAKPTLESVISTFMEESEAQGWDQGYAEAFLEQGPELTEVVEDNGEERPKKARGLGVRLLV